MGNDDGDLEGNRYCWSRLNELPVLQWQTFEAPLLLCLLIKENPQQICWIEMCCVCRIHPCLSSFGQTLLQVLMSNSICSRHSEERIQYWCMPLPVWQLIVVQLVLWDAFSRHSATHLQSHSPLLLYIFLYNSSLLRLRFLLLLLLFFLF